jgi:hypothetical protein
MLPGLITIWRRRTAGRLPAGRTIAVLCLAFIMMILPARVDAEPQFAAPEVNAYVKTLSDFRDHYLAAVTAARNGDERDLKRMDAQFPQLQQKAIRLLDKLRPDETQRYTDYVTGCGQAMVDAAYGLGLKRSG